MVTIREGAAEATPKIANDNNRSVFAWSPNNHKPRLFWLKTTSASVKPGYMVIRGTGAGGEGTCTITGAGSNIAFGIAEFDPKQVADCSVAYASGDVIPVIPFSGNDGVICRNLFITDPSADIPADTPFKSGADGSGVVSNHSIDTEYYSSLTFIADASNPTRLVGYIRLTHCWADS